MLIMKLNIFVLTLLIIPLLTACSDVSQFKDPAADLTEVNSPVISMTGGLYEPGITVEITCEAPANKIKYTTDNSDPSRTHGTTYTGPVTITETTNLKAIAYCDSCYGSEISSEFFIIKKYSFNAVIRDFTPATNPDFELNQLGSVENLVSVNLGADKKPVYSNSAGSASITSPQTFSQWYNDVPGVNLKITKPIPLALNASNYLVHEDTEFFPIDDECFGDYSTYNHNYHFTVEIHSGFIYNGNEVFRFIGDDDIWIFINNRLVIDIGGMHGAIEEAVTLDSAKAAELGLVQGQVYNLDIFTAERHTTNSTFRFFTNAVIVSTGE